MEEFKLVPDLDNPVVECYNLDLPLPPEPLNFIESDRYSDADTHGKRLHADYKVPRQYFKNLVYNHVAPLLFEHPRFAWSWPITMANFIEATDINVTLFKDCVGWSQPMHEDPRIYVVSGVLHLQDCEQGTHFRSAGYVAPTRKFSGAFWVNAQWSQHWVPEVTSERVAYIVIAQWKFLYGRGVTTKGSK